MIRFCPCFGERMRQPLHKQEVCPACNRAWTEPVYLSSREAQLEWEREEGL